MCWNGNRSSGSERTIEQLCSAYVRYVRLCDKAFAAMSTKYGDIVSDDLDWAYRRAYKGANVAMRSIVESNYFEEQDDIGTAFHADMCLENLLLCPSNLRFEQDDEPVVSENFPFSFEDHYIPEAVETLARQNSEDLHSEDLSEIENISSRLTKHSDYAARKLASLEEDAARTDARKVLRQFIEEDELAFLSETAVYPRLETAMQQAKTALEHGLHRYVAILTFAMIEAVLKECLLSDESDAMIELHQIIQRTNRKQDLQGIGPITHWSAGDVFKVARNLGIISQTTCDDCFRLKSLRNDVHLHNERTSDSASDSKTATSLSILALNEVITSAKRWIES